MCGIVGYVGKEQAAPILLDGLRRLEYRGYDSTGIAVCGAGTLRVEKSRGRLQVLSDLTHEGARHGRHRPHPLGHPRRAERYQRPPPRQPERQNRRCPQRHH